MSAATQTQQAQAMEAASQGPPSNLPLSLINSAFSVMNSLALSVQVQEEQLTQARAFGDERAAALAVFEGKEPRRAEKHASMKQRCTELRRELNQMEAQEDGESLRSAIKSLSKDERLAESDRSLLRSVLSLDLTQKKAKRKAQMAQLVNDRTTTSDSEAESEASVEIAPTTREGRRATGTAKSTDASSKLPTD